MLIKIKYVDIKEVVKSVLYLLDLSSSIFKNPIFDPIDAFPWA